MEKKKVGLFLINKGSVLQLIGMFIFLCTMVISYKVVRVGAKLTMSQLTIFLTFAILGLLWLTMFLAKYFAMPRLDQKVDDRINANWADAIRYSRYPATMILSVFGIFVWIIWAMITSDLKLYITRLPLVAMMAPLICAMIAYSFSSYYTFRGTSPLYSKEKKKNASLNSSAYWMVAEAFLILSMLDVLIIVIYLFNYIIL
jgi:hypothetical protein